MDGQAFEQATERRCGLSIPWYFQKLVRQTLDWDDPPLSKGWARRPHEGPIQPYFLRLLNPTVFFQKFQNSHEYISLAIKSTHLPCTVMTEDNETLVRDCFACSKNKAGSINIPTRIPMGILCEKRLQDLAECICMHVFKV